MATLGEKLKRERENRGVSLSEISRATNIHSKHLSALEEDNFDVLPGPVFVVGFLRAYSHHLGLDEGELLAEYESLKTAREAQSGPNSPADVGKGRFSVVTIVAVLAISGLLLYLGWPGEKHEEPARAVVGQSKTKENPQPESREEEADVSSAEEAVSVEKFSDTPEPKDEPPPPAIIATIPTPEPYHPPAPAINKKAVKKPMKTKYRLVVFAEDEDVWVFVEVDGETTHNLFVRAGQSIALRADKSITLTSGNAKSMKLTLNGKLLDVKTTPNVIRDWSLPMPE